jgi:phosphoribosylformylglycinamidine synthase
MIIHYYRKIETSHSLLPSIKENFKSLGLTLDAEKLEGVETELCFNVLVTRTLNVEETTRLEWLLAETFDKGGLRLEKSFFDESNVLEFGPRMAFTSAFSSNCVSIFKSCKLPIERCEQSRRYRFQSTDSLSSESTNVIKSMLHDRMTEEVYTNPITSFESGAVPNPVETIPIMTEGRAALEKVNRERGLGFDDFDLDYYTQLFKVCAFCWQSILAFNVLFTFLKGKTRS